MQTNKPNRTKWNYIFIALTACVMIWFLGQMRNPEEVWETVKAADLRFMAASMGCMVFFWYLEGMLLRQVSLSFGQNIGRYAAFRVSMIGQLFNNITPFASGGQPMQAYEMAQYGVPYGKSSCILLVKFVVYQLAMTLYALIVTLLKYKFFSARISGFGLFVLVGFLTNVVALSTITAVGFFPKTTHKALNWLIRIGAKLRIIRRPEALHERVETEINLFYTNFKMMRSNPKIIIGPLLVTILQLTTYFTIPYLIFRALGISNVEYTDVFCATLFVFMVTSFIPAPGASGGAEGSFYWFLSIFISNGDLLLMTTVLWRLFTFYIPILVGACFYLNRKRRRPSPEDIAKLQAEQMAYEKGERANPDDAK